MTNGPSTIYCNPRGWWFNGGLEPEHWSGPFETPEEAEKTARMLVPNKQETIKLINLQLWESREIRIERFKSCPHCKNGFVAGVCCLKCEGTGRLKP